MRTQVDAAASPAPTPVPFALRETRFNWKGETVGCCEGGRVSLAACYAFAVPSSAPCGRKLGVAWAGVLRRGDPDRACVVVYVHTWTLHQG